MPFSGFCPSFVGRFKIWAVVSFFGVGVYFIGFRSFRRSVGLVLRRLRPVAVSCARSGSPGAASVVLGFICGPLAPSGSRSAFRSDALRVSCADPSPLPGLPAVAAFPGVVYGPLLAFSLFRGFLLRLRRFRRSVGLWMLCSGSACCAWLRAAFGPGFPV